MVEDITNPTYGVLNLNYNQMQHHIEVVAELRNNNASPDTVDEALSELSYFQNRIIDICLRIGLSPHLVLENGIDPYVSRQDSGGNGHGKHQTD